MSETMKTEKSKLRRIINAIKEAFPDGNDIYGYHGITKAGVVASLENTYTCLGLLESCNNETEIVWIKRRLVQYLDRLSSLLKSINLPTWKDDFNNFLEILFDMRVAIKNLYIILADNPVRIDEDIQQAKDQHHELQEFLAKIEKDVSTITKDSEAADALIDKSEKLSADLQKSKEVGVTLVKAISELKEKAEESNQIIEEVTPSLKATFDNVEELKQNLNDLETANRKYTQQFEEKGNRIGELQKKLEAQIKLDDDLQSKIKQTLGDVNKYGMANAFYKRKNELKTTVILWGIASFVSIAAMVCISYFFAMQMIQATTFDPIRDLYKIPSLLIGIWLCWFCVRQFGFAIRIGEDYSYKCAISMAFEGYKNETREINKALLEKLLQVTLENISTNPTALYNTRSNHGSPWQELADGIKSFFKLDVKADVTADTKDVRNLVS